MGTPEGAELTQMDYEFYPQGVSHVARRVAKELLGKPILVTENGIATEDDSRRVAFIQQAAEGIQGCIADGIPVKGYFYWSLLDNFEWMKGFSMTFGLICRPLHPDQVPQGKSKGFRRIGGEIEKMP